MAYDVLPRTREDDVVLGIVGTHSREISFLISLLALNLFSFIDLLSLRIQVLYIRFPKNLVSQNIQFPRFCFQLESQCFLDLLYP